MKRLRCDGGGIYIDPWKPVDRAVITHAHADHAYPGNKSYLVARPGKQFLKGEIPVRHCRQRLSTLCCPGRMASSHRPEQRDNSNDDRISSNTYRRAAAPDLDKLELPTWIGPTRTLADG